MMQTNQPASLCGRVRTLALLSAVVLALVAVSSPLKAAPMPVSVPQTQTTDDDIVETPDVQPEYPGGEIKIFETLIKNMRYPENAAKNGVQGRVIVRFVVEKDGSVSGVTVKKSVDKELDAEAVRVVKLLSGFTPAKSNGKTVRCWFTLPITFKLN